MMRRIYILGLSLLGLIAAASATVVTYSGAIGITANGATPFLFSLGFESIPGITAVQYFWLYNIVALFGISVVGALSSERNTRFFAILVPLMAAMFFFFGWINIVDQNGLYIVGGNAQEFSMIIGCFILGVMIYMKDSLREKWGIGGPGSTVLNIVMFIAIFSAVVGLVNNPGIGLFAGAIDQNNGNVANTPQEWQNATVTNQQITSLSNTGGLLQTLISDGVLLLTLSIGALVTLIWMMLSILCVTAVLVATFPILLTSPLAMGILVVMQVGFYLLVIKLIYDVFYTKTPFLQF